MDKSLFVLSPVYLVFGLAIVALVVRELLRTGFSIRHRRPHHDHPDHHHHHHHHRAA